MRNLEVLLCQFELDDLLKILTIEKLSFAIDPWPASRFKYCAKRQPEGFIVAKVNEKVVGYIIGWITDKKGGIASIAVDPKYRREGVGHQLLAYILNYFKEKKIKRVMVEVRTANQGSIKFFKSFHFQVSKTLNRYYSNGGNAYLMEKRLG